MCPTCAAYTPAVKEAHITPIKSDYCFQRLVMDLKEFKDYTQDNNGYRYALTIIDHFSGYAWVYVLKSKTAHEVKDCLKPFFEEHGVPEIFQSDNGGEFIGTEVADLLASLSIEFVHGRPRTPRVQGKCFCITTY